MNEAPGFDAAAFVDAHTVKQAASYVPEITLHLATEVTPLWQMTELQYGETNLPPPFWAFAWPGGQALARYILDNPSLVQGKKVLDFASGCGVASIASVKAGAAKVTASDIDFLAETALGMNARLNGVQVESLGALDLQKRIKGVDLILAGDVCYQQAMAVAVMRWLRLNFEAGTKVLLADPGRAWLPEEGLRELMRYVIPTSKDLEDKDSRTAVVYELFSAS